MLCPTDSTERLMDKRIISDVISDVISGLGHLHGNDQRVTNLQVKTQTEVEQCSHLNPPVAVDCVSDEVSTSELFLFRTPGKTSRRS